MTLITGPIAVVVDASVAVDVIGDAGPWPARFQAWARSDAMLLAPPHFGVEVANALLRGQHLEPTAVTMRLQRLFLAGVELADRDLDGLLETVELAARHGLSIYDAAYLQLALDCEAEIATSDRALGRAAVAEGLVVHT